MSLYSEKLLDYIRNINSPIKTTSTTTANQGIDLSGLLSMLMMSQMFKQPTTGSSDIMNTISLLGPMSSGGGFGGSMSSVPQGPSIINPTTGGALGTNVGVVQLLQMLASIGKLMPGKL